MARAIVRDKPLVVGGKVAGRQRLPSRATVEEAQVLDPSAAAARS
jgi:hypothetical protein